VLLGALAPASAAAGATTPGPGPSSHLSLVGTPPSTSAVYDHDAPDPDVVPVTSSTGTTYYAYTTATGGENIPVLTSLDLVHWSADGDALPRLPAWQAPGRTWAPGVVPLGGRYVMYYATEMADGGAQCISEATSSSPGGPFADNRAGPLVCQTQLGGSIDPDPFVDGDGTPYLYWKSNAGASPVAAKIWVARLAADGSGLLGSPQAVLGQDQTWEATVESPAMVHAGGNYVLFYSGGSWNGAGYGVGEAVCQGPLGPCAKPIDGPLLHSEKFRLGPGGQSVFTDANGNVWMAYSAWDGPTSRFSYNSGEFRSLWLASVSFDGAPAIHAGEAPEGYLLAAADGGAFAFGAATYHGSMGGSALAAPVVGAAEDSVTGGYWEAGADGGVFSFDAPFHGSMGGLALSAPVVSMAATPDGGGYWLVGSDGGVFAFGDAGYFGSMGGRALSAPVVSIVAGPGGGGYWLVGSDGGVFAFGDAGYFGSMGGRALSAPAVSMAATPGGGGYWLVGSDGGVFAFGDAGYFGSMGGRALSAPVVSIVAGPGGGGYWLVGSDGGIFAFGDGQFLGSLGSHRLHAPVTSASST